MIGIGAFFRRLAKAGMVAAVLAVAPLAADAQQRIGPPMPTDQVLRQQNQPLPPPPSVPVPAQPAPSASPGTVPRAAGHDPVSRCQHEAAVKRVPRRQRAAYVHHCMGGG